MAWRTNYDSEGAASLGLLSGRLRGGFTASAIPRSGALDAAGSINSLSPAKSPSPSLTESSGGLQDPCSTTTDTMRVILETVKKMDRKIVSQQTKVVDSVKELTALIKSQERANFSIKGSAWEVRSTKTVVAFVHAKVQHRFHSESGQQNCFVSPSLVSLPMLILMSYQSSSISLNQLICRQQLLELWGVLT